MIWDDRCKNAQNRTSQPCIRIQDAHAIYDALTPQKKRRKKLGDEAKNQLLQVRISKARWFFSAELIPRVTWENAYI